MKILAIDVGTGTEDILLYDSENGHSLSSFNHWPDDIRM